MAILTLPNPSSLQLHTLTIPMNFKVTNASSSMLNNNNNNNNNNAIIVKKTSILQLGVGLLAASMVVATPMDANATRLNYYATVADPPCELHYVRSGLGFCDLELGSGVTVPRAELINVHYTARFADGTVFDSSYKRGRPLTMRIGVSKVIKGLDQGILGDEEIPPMQKGGKRKLVIPPHLAYGPEPAGCFSGDCNVPANATLVYDIKFVGIYNGNRK